MPRTERDGEGDLRGVSDCCVESVAVAQQHTEQKGSNIQNKRAAHTGL